MRQVILSTRSKCNKAIKIVPLRHLAEQLERKAVKEAIKQGWSWSQIAGVLGVSKQAAHKRHAACIASFRKDR